MVLRDDAKAIKVGWGEGVMGNGDWGGAKE